MVLIDPEIIMYDTPDGLACEVPHSSPTRYLSHDYFRYIGKFPPQLVRAFINSYATGNGVILDPMCGGGTTLIEAKIAGLPAVGCDINPVALLIGRVTTRYVPDADLEAGMETLRPHLQEGVIQIPLDYGEKRAVKAISETIDLGGSEKYFDECAVQDIARLKGLIEEISYTEVREFFLLALLSILRHVSLADVKKMNVVINPEKKNQKKVAPQFMDQVAKMMKINRQLEAAFQSSSVTVLEQDARKFPVLDAPADLVIMHPPYITNTAFSEFTQLQLAVLGISHKTIWSKELRNRGSYLHEPNGLKKYIVDWHGMLRNAYECLRPGGHCVTVVGDGQVDFVRIPVGTLTEEFGRDIGFRVRHRIAHRLNNNTGQTLSHKMKEQHIVILEKPC